MYDDFWCCVHHSFLYLCDLFVVTPGCMEVQR
jgi:hypothetical protein